MTHNEFRDELKKSEKQAHKRLFESYFNYVYTIVFNRLRSCASREDIEECVCDVFTDVYLSYDEDRDVSGDMSGFIGTIARRRAAALYRRRISADAPLAIDDELAEQLSSGEDVEADSDAKERQRLLLDRIAELGDPDSTIIIQKFYYGRSAKEIAEMVSLTPENIRVRSSRAVKKLREMLESSGFSL